MDANTNPDMASLGRLVPITDVKVGGVLLPTCNARELHTYLEVRRDFTNWIKGRIGKYGFTEDVDFTTEGVFAKTGEKSLTGRPTIDYHLTLDMAKELAMVENNPMGRQVRRYFIECEKRGAVARTAAVSAAIPTDPAWAAWLSLSAEERRTRQRDVLIYKQAFGAAGMRVSMHQVGMPMLPVWAIGAREQHELELARRGEGVTVTVNIPGVPGA